MPVLPPQGILRFPGLGAVIGFSFPYSHGTTPSVAMVELRPQEDYPTAPGTMTIEYGDIVIPFPFCVIDSATIHRGFDGMISHLAIKDRRWAWKYGVPVSGRYNLRSKDGTTFGSSDADPQQLAEILLIAMGEDNYDVTGLPTEPRPECNWNFANAAIELDRLVNNLGCRVVMSLDSSISIQQTGDGEHLPTDGARTVSVGVDPPDKPDTILIVGSNTRYETMFTLGPVGEEVNGDIVPINRLTYAPANGWGSEAAVNGQFGNVVCPAQWLPRFANQTAADDYVRTLARKCIYKWFKITGTAGTPLGTFLIQGYQLVPARDPPKARGAGKGGKKAAPRPKGFVPTPVQNLFQILPIEDSRVSIFTDDNDGTERPDAAVVSGSWWDKSADAQTPTITSIWHRGFSIDKAHGIVRLNEPAVTLTAGANPPFSDPVLFLTCAHCVKDPVTYIEDRATFEFAVEGDQLGVGPMVVTREDFVRQVIGQYDSSNKPTGIDDNVTQIGLEAQAYFEAVAPQFEVRLTNVLEYRGIRDDIDLDGAIQQIHWRGGKGGAFTTVSRNSEHSTEVLAYEERLRIAQHKWAKSHIRPQKHGPKPSAGQFSDEVPL